LGAAPPSFIEPKRALAAALDALVRSLRTVAADRNQSAAQRAQDAWRAVPEVELTVGATELCVGDEVALDAEDGKGRWLLPAFMSGLAKIAVTPTATPDDFLRLAEELAALVVTNESITTFQDWLYAGGAEGFEIELRMSFVELMESIAGAPTPATSVSVLRGASTVSSNELIAISTRELDVAAMRREFEVPLDEFVRAKEEGAFTLDPSESVALQRAMDDPSGWIVLETDAVLAHRELKDLVTPSSLARRISGRLGATCDARLLKWVEGLAYSPDPMLRAVMVALSNDTLGFQIASTLDTGSSEAMAAVPTFMATMPDVVRAGLARGFVERAAKEPDAALLLGRLIDHLGLPLFVSTLDLKALGDAGARRLAEVIRERTGAERVFRDLIAGVTEGTAARILAQLPVPAVDALTPQVTDLLAWGAPETISVLLDAFEGVGPRRRFGELLGGAFETSRGQKWSERNLQRACNYMVSAGLADSHVVPLAREPKASVPLRLSALDALTVAPAALDRAIEWRARDLFEPAEVVSRLKSLRQARKSAPPGGDAPTPSIPLERPISRAPTPTPPPSKPPLPQPAAPPPPTVPSTLAPSEPRTPGSRTSSSVYSHSKPPARAPSMAAAPPPPTVPSVPVFSAPPPPWVSAAPPPTPTPSAPAPTPSSLDDAEAAERLSRLGRRHRSDATYVHVPSKDDPK